MGRIFLATLIRNEADHLVAYLSKFFDHLNVNISPHLPPIVFECKIQVEFNSMNLRYVLKLLIWNIDGCWKEFSEAKGYTNFDCSIVFNILETEFQDGHNNYKNIKEECEEKIENYMIDKLKANELIYIEKKQGGFSGRSTNIYPPEQVQQVVTTIQS